MTDPKTYEGSIDRIEVRHSSSIIVGDGVSEWLRQLSIDPCFWLRL